VTRKTSRHFGSSAVAARPALLVLPEGANLAGVVSAGGPVAATEAARLPLRPFRPPPLPRRIKGRRLFQGCEGSPVGEASVAAAGTTASLVADFLRIEPQAVPFGALRVSSVQPSQTWILDLAPDAADLMKGMHPKTRYNIGLASARVFGLTASA